MGYWDTIKAWAKKAYFTLLAWAKAAYYTLFEKHLGWTLLFSMICAICACAFGIAYYLSTAPNGNTNDKPKFNLGERPF